MSKTSRYSYVGTIFTASRSGFPLLCSKCEKPIPQPDMAAVYFDLGPAVFVVIGMECEAAVQAQ